MRILYISRPTLLSVPGGDTIQMLKTKEYLEKSFEISIDIWDGNKDVEYANYDLIHFFNIIRPNNILTHINEGVPFVLSPIYVDYSEYDQKIRGGKAAKIARVFGKNRSEYLKSMIRWWKNGEHPGSIKYIFSGHKKAIKKILNSTSVILANSKSELNRLMTDFSFNTPSLIVPNATDLTEIKINSKREGVVSVARIEGLKNQLNLIRAIKKTDLRLTIIGKASPNHAEYYKQCQNEANDQVSFVDHISQEELRNYYSSAKVHAMISWFETTGLSTLEAAAFGCNVVISEKGDQREYFKENAFYADPDDIDSIKDALLKANSAAIPDALIVDIKNKYTWEETAKKTMDGYKLALS